MSASPIGREVNNLDEFHFPYRQSYYCLRFPLYGKDKDSRNLRRYALRTYGCFRNHRIDMDFKLHTYFSQRNGYRIPEEQLTLESISTEVSSAIQSAFIRFLRNIEGPLSTGKESSNELCEYLWTHFFHRNLSTLSSDPFGTNDEWVLKEFSSPKAMWYTKLDFIEAVIDIASQTTINKSYIKDFVNELNDQFESLSFGYRIVKGNVIAITSEIEKSTIESAIDKSPKTVKDTLSRALSAHCSRPVGDYTGSMKNSISAIEIECHRITGEKKLGPALKKLKSKGLSIHPQLEVAFQNLYNYSNDEKTGIRHGKKIPEDTYVPTAKESLFLLVTSSAFINYLRSCEVDMESKSE